jgi:hypothetical protein
MLVSSSLISELKPVNVGKANGSVANSGTSNVARFTFRREASVYHHGTGSHWTL